MIFDPLAATISAYNNMADDYAERWFESSEVQDFVAEFIKKMDTHSSVIDAGCGSGREIRELCQRDIDCIGIDLSASLVAKATALVPEAHFRVMDMREMSFPDSLFDGLLCIACLHHLHNEDLMQALSNFSRVLKPDGIAAVTIRVGEGEEFDEFGRFVKYRDKDDLEKLLSRTNFVIETEWQSHDDMGRQWLQVFLKNEKPALTGVPLCPFCPGDFFFSNNRVSSLPVAASILFGDEDAYVAVDRSPLCEGHLLICTRNHALSTMSSEVRLEKIAALKAFCEDLLFRAYRRKPIFLEHGIQRPDEFKDSCVEHAHVHALPLQRPLKSKIESEIGRLRKIRDERRMRQVLKDTDYISYEDKTGHIFFRDEDVSSLPSQFFRLVVASHIGLSDSKGHWRPMQNDPDTLLSFRRTIETLTSVLNQDQAERQVSSLASEAILNRLTGKTPVKLISGRSAKAEKVARRLKREAESRQIVFSEATLDDFGEELLTEEVIYSFFDEGYRGEKYLGDDAAVFSPKANEDIVVTVDPCPTPVAFELGIRDFRAFGWLAMTISLSDVAAMGGEPFGALLTCEMPESMRVEEFIDFLDGVLAASDRYKCRILGGNIREAKKFGASTTLLGYTKGRRHLSRDGAVPGDSVFVVGTMGLFWASVLNQLEEPLIGAEHLSLLESALLFPQPKVRAALELASLGVVTSAMDASDGPTRCFHEIASASSVDIHIDYSDLVPHDAVHEVAKLVGVDPIALMMTWGNFELIFTANEGELIDLYGDNFPHETITKIGHVVEGSGRALISKGKKLDRLPDLSSLRFRSRNSLLAGINNYHNYLKTVRV